MPDGQGQVRVMDFGLAAFAAEASDVRSGTPAYMAPEQKAGREVTPRSDIYSLGVLVHEIYTGKCPSEKTSSKTEIDPAVASVVERCLSDDPQRRPASAIAVLTALPAGDPLAAALAAGETPSPEMVANAGSTEGASVRWAVACLGLLLTSLAAFYVAQSKYSAVEMIRNLESPEMLAGRARDYIRSFGYNEAPKDTASWVGVQSVLPESALERDERSGSAARISDTATARHHVLVPPASVGFVFFRHARGHAQRSIPARSRWCSIRRGGWLSFMPPPLSGSLMRRARRRTGTACSPPPDSKWSGSSPPNLSSLRDPHTMCARRGKASILPRQPPKFTSRRRRMNGRFRRFAS